MTEQGTLSKAYASFVQCFYPTPPTFNMVAADASTPFGIIITHGILLLTNAL